MFIPEPTRISINHPMADEISIVNHQYAYAGENSSELAFFVRDNWVTEPIPEFAEYADAEAGDTRVYGWVPNDLLDAFLEKYRA